VKIIFNKTKSVLSLKNFGEKKDNIGRKLKNSQTLKVLKDPNQQYHSDDDSIRTSNRANNETISLNSSASSHYLLNITS